MQPYDIEAFTYEIRSILLPRLAAALGDAGGCILERRAPAPQRAELVFEQHVGTLIEVYTALAAVGIELTRTGQQTLIALCRVGRYLHRGDAPMTETVSIRLVIRFLEDAPLDNLLTRSCLIV